MPSALARYAAELVALAPDVILAAGAATVGAMLQATARYRSCSCCLRSGRRRLRRRASRGRAAMSPAFMPFEFGMSGEMARTAQGDRAQQSRVRRSFGIASASGIGQFAAIQTAAPSLGVEVSPVDLRDAAEIERAIAAFARAPNGGLIVTASALSAVHRDLIVALGGPAQAARDLLQSRRSPQRRADVLRR